MTRESEWDEDERTWMLGLALREAEECRRCGGVLAETTDYGFKWVPTLPTVCLRCVALRADEEAHSKSPYRGALIHHVKKSVRLTPKNRKRKKG